MFFCFFLFFFCFALERWFVIEEMFLHLGFSSEKAFFCIRKVVLHLVIVIEEVFSILYFVARRCSLFCIFYFVVRRFLRKTVPDSSILLSEQVAWHFPIVASSLSLELIFL